MLVVLLAAAAAMGPATASASASAETAHIPVEAEDAAEVALDAEVDTALHHSDEAPVEADQDFAAIDAEMGVEGMSLDSNTDLSMPAADADSFDAVDAVVAEEGLGTDEEEAADQEAEEDMALIGEAESVSVAVSEAESDSEESEGESASAAVDSDEDTSFLQVEDEEEEEEEEEDESEDEDEEEAEDEDESDDEEADTQAALQTALIEQIVEADVDDSADEEAAAAEAAMTDAGIELVTDSAAATVSAAAVNSDSAGVTVAEVDHSHDEAAAEMVNVVDFDTAKLAAAENEPVRTAGRVTAGLLDASIEAKNVPAEVAPVDHDVIAVVSDKDVRKAAGAAFVETDAEAEVEAEVESEVVTEAEHESEYHQSAEERAAEQQKLDLMHSVMVQLRTEQGRPVDEELTPADMDEIESRLAVMVEVHADAVTNAAADTETKVDANANANAKAEAEHPRDHTVKPAIAPTVQPTTEGAALKPATIVDGRPKPLRIPKAKYRWDIRYRPDRRQFLSGDHVELVEHAHPLHRRDPTKPSKLKKPVKPGVWDRRPWETRPKQAYRYDVEYERRSACCSRREACCIRGVDTKTVPKRVMKPVKVLDPEAEARKAREARRKARANKKKFVRVEYEAERAKCCGAKSACCAPPQKMYDADVQYLPGGAAADYVVVATTGERGLVIDSADAGEYTLVDGDELSILERIQARQALLHKLLLTHESPFYYPDHFDTASDEHIAVFHEPAAARDPNQLSLADQMELAEWMKKLPVVPALSVIETSAAAHAASGNVFLQTDAESEAEADAYTVKPVMKPARVLKGFVDVEQEPTTLSTLLSSLPPMPLAAEEQHDEEEDAMAEAEADYAEDI